MKQDILLIGHRGANKEAPENTLKSFQKAIDLGADYIEFDIHLSKDREIVIMHDDNTYRTTGHQGIIKQMTLSELKALDCGEGEQIPTLQELIHLAKNKIGLQCEIKAEGLVIDLVKILKKEALIENTIVSSFKHGELIKVQQEEPRLKIAPLEPTGTGWLTDWIQKKKIIDNAAKQNYYGVHPLYRLVNKELIEYAHKKELKVNVWTVDSKRAMEKLIDQGIDGIITNDIQKAKKVLNR
ncbi:MAG: Glycerophosphoryl diester phosphodiesterase [Promethearchaeota archaeon]|jgi:glycerophosphoryl diester phosphodiesterase|nr:MAG: Glycerophosphoryl diester phosphodiesterase [Candidatus Lokiarchaeota archaeon]